MSEWKYKHDCDLESGGKPTYIVVIGSMTQSLKKKIAPGGNVYNVQVNKQDTIIMQAGLVMTGDSDFSSSPWMNEVFICGG